MSAAAFATDGVVFASTRIHVRVPGRSAPRGLCYVDLTDGPRVLAESRDTTADFQVGTAVVIDGVTEHGDLAIRRRGADA